MADSGGGSGYDPKALGGTLGGKLTQFANSPVPVFPEYSYPGLSGSTTNALTRLESDSFNPTYSGAVGNTISDFGDIASGKRFGMDDPGYAAVRQGVADDTISGINSVFNSSGRFGAGSHREALGEGLGRALGELDYGNFQNDQSRQFAAADRLPGMFGASLAPAQTQLGVGQVRDADASAMKASRMDWFDRNYNADYNRFLELLGAFNGSSQSPGMTPEPPWWQIAGGLGSMALGGLGMFL